MKCRFIIKEKRKSWLVSALLLLSLIFVSGCTRKVECNSVIETPKTQTTEISSGENVIKQEEMTTEPEVDFSICFAGDINLDENWCTTQHLNNCNAGISDCISPELIDRMKSADIMCLNNEFTYSDRGTPLPGKAYTFRANPSKVEILDELGVDVVSLANNHVYDYGNEALLDTFDTLSDDGISYFGAGKNLQEACKPIYLKQDGKTIAFVAASRAEKNKMTPQATNTKAGILRCYDTELFDEVIKEADANADIVIACVHWGTEYSNKLEQVQIDTAKEYIDCGADLIIGAHSHCLQGIEYYKGKPIFYGLGNYWFNEKTLDTMLVEVRFTAEGDDIKLQPSIVPALQAGCETQYISDATKQRKLYDYLESISFNIQIDDSGVIKAK